MQEKKNNYNKVEQEPVPLWPCELITYHTFSSSALLDIIEQRLYSSFTFIVTLLCSYYNLFEGDTDKSVLN